MTVLISVFWKILVYLAKKMVRKGRKMVIFEEITFFVLFYVVALIQLRFRHVRHFKMTVW